MSHASKLKLLHRMDYPHLTADEFSLFVIYCEQKGLNPWLRHIRPEPYFNRENGRTELRMITTIAALRIIALNTGKYQGLTGPTWCGKDGAWVDVWLNPQPPAAATASVHRKGFKNPVNAVALWESYCPLVPDKEGRPVPSDFWMRMGAFMLGKCAEAMALRAAFPERLSGLLTDDELQPGWRERVTASDEGSPRGWNPLEPKTPFQFQLALCEMGLPNPADRERIVEAFRHEHRSLAAGPPELFYRFVVHSIRANPTAFGVAEEAIA